MARSQRRTTQTQDTGSIRIIGGQWRGRRLAVANRPGLRPTTDRIRETVFNWLQPDVCGARCLDLFAGTGAMGLEALSRGAASCTFVELDPTAARQLTGLISDLSAGDRARCVNDRAEAFLKQAHTPYDLIFLDPPFDADLLGPISAALQPANCCHEDTLAYVEHGRHHPEHTLPDHWSCEREKAAGDVVYGLYRVNSEEHESL